MAIRGRKRKPGKRYPCGKRTREETEKDSRIVHECLNELVKDKKITRDGNGIKGSPFKFSITPLDMGKINQ